MRSTSGCSVRHNKGAYFTSWLVGLRYIVDHLVNNYGIEDDVTKLLNEVELIMLPVANPDGYVRSSTCLLQAAYVG